MKQVLIEALKKAGKIQLNYFGKTHREIAKESISSIVTEVDIESEKCIIETIISAYPNHSIISEERGYIDNHSNYTWVIDPIDGTSNFAAGIPWFEVLIALFENNIPVLGGAYLPVSGDLYMAEKGKGAHLNDKKLHIPDKELSNVLFAFSTDYSADADYQNFGICLYQFLVQNARNVRCTNSLVDALLVAEGKLGGCINMFTKIWDIAATYLIVKEAGGIFKNLNFTEINFDLNPQNMLKNYGIVAGSNSVVRSIETGLSEI
jgi:myo-inositol-1(or 4)-monophosphatase